MHSPRSAAFTQETHGLTDSEHLVSRHTTRETIISAVLRWQSREGILRFEPLGGLAVSHATDELTERSGTYFFGTSYPITAPDIYRSITRLGIVAGGDVLFPIRGSAFVPFGGARLYWIDRSPTPLDRAHFAPTAGGGVLVLIAGVHSR